MFSFPAAGWVAGGYSGRAVAAGAVAGRSLNCAPQSMFVSYYIDRRPVIGAPGCTNGVATSVPGSSIHRPESRNGTGRIHGPSDWPLAARGFSVPSRASESLHRCSTLGCSFLTFPFYPWHWKNSQSAFDGRGFPGARDNGTRSSPLPAVRWLCAAGQNLVPFCLVLVFWLHFSSGSQGAQEMTRSNFPSSHS